MITMIIDVRSLGIQIQNFIRKQEKTDSVEICESFDMIMSVNDTLMFSFSTYMPVNTTGCAGSTIASI